ncbi:glycosyltransferase [Candidatus Chloroploca sp. M-50]|uniref:Glycosyltransferase n=1 Tax=Candidatus Chloroploca mongolica TaxID=2528176 RepID=A0ABS4D6E1_9CHLR|nr:glycosyltransferase [Candidatus Chloroploca mongolica]MBP1465004.1 glycosyltransferase [Candidatus Chloroploca mongolica]
MKILIVLTYYHPHWTGLTVHAVRVAEHLAVRGHQVTVLTSRHASDLARDEMLNGVRVVRLQPVARFSRGMVTPAFPWAAARLIAEHEVVQIHTPLPEAPLVALLCRSLGRPLLMTHHGDVVMPDSPVEQLLEQAAFQVLRTAASLADGLTSYSEDYARHSRLLSPFHEKLTCILPPVEFPEPDSTAAAAWKQELGLADRRLIGFGGRWVSEKGFDDLLRALPLIRAEVPEAHLVFAGERNVVYDDFYAICRPLIEAEQEHITFLGLIKDRERLASFYAMLDLFVLPSHTDMMAITQVEALLCGTPVVATDIPGARVVVRETGFGQLAPPHDPPGLARTILATLAKRERYRPSRDVVCRIFDTDQTMNAYEQLLARLVQTRSRSDLGARASRRLVGGSWPALAAAPMTAAASLHSLNGAPQAHTGLSADDRALLGQLLRNEADMAYRRRAPTLLGFLDLHDGETVLDCGCGMGVYLMMMGRLRRLNLIGVDGDRERLHWAEREQVPADLSEVDIHQLPFADASFDKVLMSEVLEHLQDDRGALREIWRILKPGGILAISVPHANYPFWWDPINKTIEAFGGQPITSAGPITGIWSNHERLYLPEQLREAVREAGFTVEVVEEQTHYSFPFIHFIVYSIGKPLIERNLLPKGLRDSADRFRGERNSGSPLNPINLGVGLFRLFDARNDRLRGTERTFVTLALKARKPG